MKLGPKLGTGILILCLIGGSFGARSSSDVLKFSDQYEVKGILTVPEAEIHETFHAWFDHNTNASRIDFYDGSVKTYQYSRGFGTLIQVAPNKDQDNGNHYNCWRLNGTEAHKVLIQSVFPDVSEFTLIGDDLIDGVPAEKWERSATQNSVTRQHTLWVRYDKRVGDSEKKVAVPVRYEVKANHELLDSVYDLYFLDYDWVSNKEIDPSTFEDLEDVCKDITESAENLALLNPMREYINGEDEHISDAFEKFKIRYDRHYNSATEEALRRKIFANNYRFVMSTNRESRSFTAGINHFADQTAEEMQGNLGSMNITEIAEDESQVFVHGPMIDDMAIPVKFNWVNKGAVMGVKNQGRCSSCWSFGATAAVEGALFVKCDHLASMSEQALIDCSGGTYGNHGCAGGSMLRSFKWMRDAGGLPPSNIYGAYQAEAGTCHVDEIDVKDKIRVSSYHRVSANIDDIKIALMTKGPLAVAFDSSRKSFQHYKEGVYDQCECKKGSLCGMTLGHAGVLVGFGVDEKQGPYWIVRNSWGDTWGHEGYALIPQDMSKDCGISIAPYYLELENCLPE